MDNRVKVLS